MASVRFNHLFAGLMGLGFVTAFVLPPQMSVSGPGILQGIFSPVSRPVRAITRLVYRQFHTETIVDSASREKPRAQQTVYEENEALRSAYASLENKFEALSKLNADRQAVGDIRNLCRPATVTGTSVLGLHETLNITVGGSSSVLTGRPVIRGNPSQVPLPCDLIGRISRSGPAGAEARLVTDPGFALTARIARYVPQSDGRQKLIFLDQLHRLLIVGVGHNQMIVGSNISLQDVQATGLAVNDLVLLDDNGWPPNIQGFAVGTVVSIGHQAKHPLLADIRIEPQGNLMRLNEVMVMIGD